MTTKGAKAPKNFTLPEGEGESELILVWRRLFQQRLGADRQGNFGLAGGGYRR